MIFSTRYRWLALCLVALSWAHRGGAETAPRPFWAQFTVETCQNVICRTRLAMWPADSSDLAGVNWQTVAVSGQASTKSSTQLQLDARNSAIATLLTYYGRKWIQGQSLKTDTFVRDRASVRYEAIVMLPLRELSHNYSQDGTVFSGTWQVRFSRAAYGPPSPWDRVKAQLSDALKDVFSVFH